MALSKNHAARLKKVDASLDRAMDGLMQANGQLWPRELRSLGETVQSAVDILRKASAEIEARLRGEIVDDPKADTSDPDQEDIEDVTGVAQPQPEKELDENDPPPAGSPASRRRRAAA